MKGIFYANLIFGIKKNNLYAHRTYKFIYTISWYLNKFIKKGDF